MKNIFIIFLVLVILVLSGLAFWVSKKNMKQKTAAQLIPVTIALDWTPNTNHTGIYVALSKGWYKAQGLSVKVLPYSESVTPDVLVYSGKADFGISSTEGIVADAALGNPVVSLAGIVAHNTSVLAVRTDSGIKTPKDLNGKIYGGFGAPFEQAVVSAIIKKQGGKGDFKNVTLDTDAMQALETKKIDFVWIFQGWEGIQAKRENVALTTFPITQFGIADYYTPVIVASQKEIQKNSEVIKKFMAATAMGYEYARQHSKDAANLLVATAPKGTFPDTGLVQESQEFLSKNYADNGEKWGIQKAEFWHGYPQFMLDSGSILDSKGKPVEKMDFDSLYTNEFLPK